MFKFWEYWAGDPNYPAPGSHSQELLSIVLESQMNRNNANLEHSIFMLKKELAELSEDITFLLHSYQEMKFRLQKLEESSRV
jgi:hypothetical protein